MKKGPRHLRAGILKWISALYLLRGLLLLGIIAGFAATAVLKVQSYLYATGGALLVWLFLSALHLMESSSCKCSVCRTPLFENSRKKGRRIHDRAQSFLGSYRLRRSISILFLGFYRCNHCGERIQCVNDRSQGPSESKQRVTRGRSLPTDNREKGRRIG